MRRGRWVRMLPPGKRWLRDRALLDPGEEMPDGEDPPALPMWDDVAEALGMVGETPGPGPDTCGLANPCF